MYNYSSVFTAFSGAPEADKLRRIPHRFRECLAHILAKFDRPLLYLRVTAAHCAR